MKRNLWFWLLIICCPFAVQAQSRVTVYWGDNTRLIAMGDEARLADLLTHPLLPSEPYWPLALISNRERSRQVEAERQRLIKVLTLLEYRWGRENQVGLSQMARLLAQALDNLHLAGRLTGTLDPDWVRIRSIANPPLAGEYQLFLANHPKTIHIMGLVSGHAHPAILPGAPVASYLRERRFLPGADRNQGYLVKTNGDIEVVGLAYWNRKHREPDPGASLYVGFDAKVLPKENRDLNQRIAQLLANRIPE